MPCLKSPAQPECYPFSNSPSPFLLKLNELVGRLSRLAARTLFSRNLRMTLKRRAELQTLCCAGGVLLHGGGLRCGARARVAARPGRGCLLPRRRAAQLRPRRGASPAFTRPAMKLVARVWVGMVWMMGWFDTQQRLSLHRCPALMQLLGMCRRPVHQSLYNPCFPMRC